MMVPNISWIIRTNIISWDLLLAQIKEKLLPKAQSLGEKTNPTWYFLWTPRTLSIENFFVIWRNLRCGDLLDIFMWKFSRSGETLDVNIFGCAEISFISWAVSSDMPSKYISHCFAVWYLLVELMLFCRKIRLFAIYAVLSRDLFCRDLRVFCVGTNYVLIFVRGEKMTNIMYSPNVSNL